MVSSATLAAKIVEKGLDRMDFSILPDSLKFDILSATAELFLKRNDFENALRAFVIANNKVRMVEIGRQFLERKHFEVAAKFLVPSGNAGLLEKAGLECALLGNFGLAMQAFEVAGNVKMADFLKANFLQRSP